MMQPTMEKRQQLIGKLSEWGNACADIRAVALVGSETRSEHPADEWSDVDVLLIALDPGKYLQSTEWFGMIDDPWVNIVERNDRGEIVERRVLFRNGVDVDFLVLGHDRLEALHHEPLASITRRGIKPLVDKDAILPGFAGEPQVVVAKAPTHTEFCETVNDFWFHAVWTAKKNRRGETWIALSCCNVYMKRLLLRMVEWNNGCRDGWDTNTWYNGRFIEQWAAEDVVEDLRGVFAHYDKADIWRALQNTMRLFDRLARETGKQLGYAYPEDRAQSIAAWVMELAAGSNPQPSLL